MRIVRISRLPTTRNTTPRVLSIARSFHVQFDLNRIPYELGRSIEPFSFSPSLKGKGKEPEKPGFDYGSERVSDAEWDLIVGRGLYVLTSNLPQFFESGLVLNASQDEKSEENPIYSKNIDLCYTLPVALPGLPPTIHIQGLALYQASAVLLKTSLTTFYSNCKVELNRMSLVPGAGPRERHVKIDLGMHGTSRLTGAKATWNVLSTYSFSPLTGLIYRHRVESIYPAPHSAVFDSIRESLLRLVPPSTTQSEPAHCHNHITDNHGPHLLPSSSDPDRRSR